MQFAVPKTAYLCYSLSELLVCWRRYANLHHQNFLRNPVRHSAAQIEIRPRARIRRATGSDDVIIHALAGRYPIW